MSSPPAEQSESPNGLSISETEPISIPESEPSPPAADPDSKDEAAVEESTDDVQPADAGDRNLEESKGDDHNAVEVQAVNAEAIDAVEEAAVEAVKAVEVEEEKQNGENSVKESDSEQIVEIPLKSIDVKGSKSFTMRELLDELKKDPSNPDETSDQQQDGTPLSEQSNQQYLEQNNAAMELITSVTGADEEGQSRQRILTFAARRYATALERNPDDYDALYNWALVLQESADNVSPDSSSPSKDALLEEACKKYEEATRLCPTLNDAYYNWAIAISDRAKMRGRTKEAEELWKQATKNYEKAVQLNWNSPQALNNWGLALQELSAIVPAREKQTIVKTAINKFRAAIQLQFDFHRAIYNLGTVLYGLAEDMSRTGGSNSKEVSHDELYSQSAIYIAAAHALKPTYSVYTSALKLVRSMLPLPYLKVGYLTAPPPGNPLAPHTDWKHSQFVLNHEGLHQINKAEQRYMSESLFLKTEDTGSFTRPAIRVEVPDILSVSACSDLTLPPGAGLCIGTIHGPVYLIAESWEYLDGWLDAIRLVYTIYARGKSEVLAGIIA